MIATEGLPEFEKGGGVGVGGEGGVDVVWAGRNVGVRGCVRKRERERERGGGGGRWELPIPLIICSKPTTKTQTTATTTKGINKEKPERQSSTICSQLFQTTRAKRYIQMKDNV